MRGSRASRGGVLVPWLAALLLAGPAGCAHGRIPEIPRSAWATAPHWPDTGSPRIVHTGVITSEADIVASRGFLGWLGHAIAGNGEAPPLVRPAGVAVGAGRLVVADPGIPAVLVFDLRSGQVRRVERVGGLTLTSPLGVALDASGRLYLTDSALGLVARLDADLEEADVLQAFERPTGIAVRPQTGEVYVVDTLAHQVVVLAEDLSLDHAFGRRGEAPGELNFPTFATFGPEGDLWVVDAMNGRVQRFSPEGEARAVVGMPGDSAGSFAHPKGVAFDPDGHLYVVDALFGNVQIFDRGGQLLLPFGHSGSGEAALDLPTGIAIDGEGRIYVADSGNHRVQIFRILEADAP